MNSKRLSPAKAVRRFCLDCMNGSASSVRACTSEHCLFYDHRMGKGRVTLRLMRTYCLHCHGWPIKEGKLDPDYKDGGQACARDQARDCTDQGCPLFPYRPGTTPFEGRGRIENLHSPPIADVLGDQEAPEIESVDEYPASQDKTGNQSFNGHHKSTQ